MRWIAAPLGNAVSTIVLTTVSLFAPSSSSAGEETHFAFEAKDQHPNENVRIMSAVHELYDAKHNDPGSLRIRGESDTVAKYRGNETQHRGADVYTYLERFMTKDGLLQVVNSKKVWRPEGLFNPVPEIGSKIMIIGNPS